MRPHNTTLMAMVLFLVLTQAALASTRYVNGASGKDSNNCLSSTAACKTIGHAISLASSGDSIMVAAATYQENLTVSKSLNIMGSGASTTIIDGGASNTVVTISNTTAHVTVSNLTIRNGKAFGVVGGLISGGGINNAGTLTLTSSTVSGNFAPIPCQINGLFYTCVGTAVGGGIYNSGELTISNSTISGNGTGGGCTGRCFAFGGGISNGGTLMMIQNSTLTGNNAGVRCPPYLFLGLHCNVGGGAVDSSGGTVTLNNSTVEGNNATCSGACKTPGGAIVNSSGNLVMNNSTVSGNPAGGIFNNGTATLQNSIIANNSGEDCSGTVASHGYNLSSDGSCAFSNSGDRDNTNPVLGTLGSNGGPTPTIPLLAGSPAIDAGNPSGCTDGHGNLLKTDQRGMPRPDKEDSGGCDMGAYERQTD